MLGLAKKLFGSSNDRKVKAMLARVADDQRPGAADRGALRRRAARPRPQSSATAWPRARRLDDLLDEAFAVVREAAKRTLGQRHYDVQLVGGMVLHNGGIAEMRTGEGKTLVATAAGLSERARRQGRARDHRQRLPGAARRRVDGPGLPLPGHERRRDRPRPEPGRAPARLRQPTSPTAPTTSSASTTCATTWSTTPARWSSAATTSRSSTRSTRS